MGPVPRAHMTQVDPATLRARLALQDDLHQLAQMLRAGAQASPEAIARLIAAGYAPTPLRVLARLAAELADHEEQS